MAANTAYVTYVVKQSISEINAAIILVPCTTAGVYKRSAADLIVDLYLINAGAPSYQAMDGKSGPRHSDRVGIQSSPPGGMHVLGCWVYQVKSLQAFDAPSVDERVPGAVTRDVQKAFEPQGNVDLEPSEYCLQRLTRSSEHLAVHDRGSEKHCKLQEMHRVARGLSVTLFRKFHRSQDCLPYTFDGLLVPILWVVFAI